MVVFLQVYRGRLLSEAGLLVRPVRREDRVLPVSANSVIQLVALSARPAQRCSTSPQTATTAASVSASLASSSQAAAAAAAMSRRYFTAQHLRCPCLATDIEHCGAQRHRHRHLAYAVFQKRPPFYFLNNSVKN